MMHKYLNSDYKHVKKKQTVWQMMNNNNISTISVTFAKNFEFELKFWENFIKCQSFSFTTAFAWSIIRNDKYSSTRILCKDHGKYVCRRRRGRRKEKTTEKMEKL